MTDRDMAAALEGARAEWAAMRQKQLGQLAGQSYRAPEVAMPFVPPEPVELPQRADISGRLQRDVEDLAAGWLVWRAVRWLRTRRPR
jgi:hypothetical protein